MGGSKEAESAIPPSVSTAVHVEDSRVVAWEKPYDPDNPYDWTTRTKWGITVLVSMITINVTFASSGPTAIIEDIAIAFRVSGEVANLVTTLFLLGYITGPLFWGPCSEIVGRRPILIFTLSCYTLCYLGQALGPNIQTFLVTRFFGGFFAVAPLTVCGGLIADVWMAAGRGPAASLYAACIFLGPVLGPIVGGFIADSSLSWRWVFWVSMMYAGACTSAAILLLPETYAPVLLARKARKLRKANSLSIDELYAQHEMLKWSFKSLVQRTVYQPIKMLGTEPILVLVTLYMSTVYGVLYLLFDAIPIVFIETRGLSLSQGGLIFVGVGIGSTCGGILNSFCLRHYPELIKKWRGFPPPENRLYGAMCGAPCLVIGSFWLGWTGNYPSIPWYVPAIGTIFIGLSISIIFMSFTAYLIDTFLQFSASAFAANVVVRSLTASAMPLFTNQMYEKLGINWASTLIGLIGLLLAPIPFVFFKYGARIRARSILAPCLDLKIAKQLRAEELRAAQQPQPETPNKESKEPRAAEPETLNKENKEHDNV